MNRRDVLRALSVATIVVAHPARAQNSPLPVVGILYGASTEEWPNRLVSFRLGLAEAGYVEGRNVALDVRLLGGTQADAASAAADLVRRQVAVIVATGGPQPAIAATAATKTIPIVVTFGGDPVKAGMVASLNRPAGNVTGVTILTVDLAAKLLDVYRELLPRSRTAALLVDPRNPVSQAYAVAAGDAARRLGLELRVVKASSESEIDTAFEAVREARAGGLLVAADPFFEIRRAQLIALADRSRTPTFYFVREFVALGGLASYGTNFNDVARAAGAYAGRILKGARPDELPVLEPERFELAINLATARKLGLTVPRSLLLRADEVVGK